MTIDEEINVLAMQSVNATLNPLAPDGIENLQPKCTVCCKPVPKQRVSTRTRFTCGPACLKVLQDYKKHVMKMHMCMVCQRPCTPEEKKEFIAFRKHRGERRPSPGRPTTEKKIHAMRDLLRQAITPITNFAESLRNSGDDPQLAEDLAGMIERIQIVLDGKAAKSTLAASGETTGGEN